MRRSIAFTLIAAGLLGAGATLFVPATGSACAPCEAAESGEHWALEVVSWTIDDASVPTPDAGAKFSVENPWGAGGLGTQNVNDPFLDGVLLDPLHPSTPRSLLFEREDR